MKTVPPARPMAKILLFSLAAEGAFLYEKGQYS